MQFRNNWRSMWGNTMRYPMLLGLGLIPLSAKRRLFHDPPLTMGTRFLSPSVG